MTNLLRKGTGTHPDIFQEVKQHLKEVVEIGVIRKSFSRRTSAVVLVRKKV